MNDVEMCNDEDVENRCSVLEGTMGDLMISASHLVDVLHDMGATQEAEFVQEEALEKRRELR